MEIQISLAIAAIGISIFAGGFFLGSYHKAHTLDRMAEKLLAKMDEQVKILESQQQ